MVGRIPPKPPPLPEPARPLVRSSLGAVMVMILLRMHASG